MIFTTTTSSNSNFFDTNTLSASAGFAELYQPTRDLLFNVYGNYTRERDIFNSALNFNNGAIGPAGTPPSNIPLIINPFGTTPSVNPIPFNQFTGGASGTATSGPGFATLGATAFYILYDESPRQCTGTVPDLTQWCQHLGHGKARISCRPRFLCVW